MPTHMTPANDNEKFIENTTFRVTIKIKIVNRKGVQNRSKSLAINMKVMSSPGSKSLLKEFNDIFTFNNMEQLTLVRRQFRLQEKP